MKFNNQTIKFFKLSFLVIFFAIPFSVLIAQESLETDFSNAVDGEEKRKTWGTEEHKQSLIDEMSSANVSLFVDEHLVEIKEPSRIFYKFEKFSTLEDSFIGNVVLNIVKIDDVQNKYITFRYLKGRNKVRFPPQIGAKGNPVFMLFFERDSRDMQRLTGGNALFFRSRIRHAIAAAETKTVEIMFNQNLISAKEISFTPFENTKLRNRVTRYKNKKFKVILSEKIPGHIFKIETYTKDSANENDIVKETLTYQGIKTNKELRELYKRKKESEL